RAPSRARLRRAGSRASGLSLSSGSFFIDRLDHNIPLCVPLDRRGFAMRVSMTVNGSKEEHDVEPRLLLVHYLREVLGLAGTKIGCDTTSCGACTVLLDGESVKSCTMLAVQADGAGITTIEGLATNGDFHPMQQAFHENHGLQCGYCTAGLVTPP